MIETRRSVFDTFSAACARWPDQDFLAVGICDHDPGDTSVTFSEVAVRVAHRIRLLEDGGYGPGHVLALMQGNRIDHFLWLLAMNARGCVAVPLQTEGTPDELAYVVDHATVALVIAAPPFHARLTEALTLTRTGPLLTDGLGDALPHAAEPSRRLPDRQEKNLACVLYTSGTTGRPKGCMIPNEYFTHIGRYYAQAGGCATLRDAQERIFTPLPVFHQNAGLFTFMGAMMTGNCMVMTDRFRASTWWQEVADNRATVIHYLGVMPAILLNCPGPKPGQLDTVRFGIGAGVDPSLHVAFEDRFGFPLVELWGMTETGGGFIASEEPRQIDRRAFGRPKGRPGVDFDIRLIDHDGQEVAQGTPGELLVRRLGPDPQKGMFLGYLNDAVATAEVWKDGWFHSGDVVVQDPTGMLSFVERRKNIIRRSGENIAAAEVESVLAALPGIRQAVVVAVPDAIREEEVMAVVVPSEGTETGRVLAEDIVRGCLRALAYFKAPGWVLFRDSLPATSTQKVQKQRIFKPGEDPFDQPDLWDLRSMKKP